MKSLINSAVLAAAILVNFMAYADTNKSAFNIKPHHAQAFGEGKHCDTCHTDAGKKSRPSSQTCINCHGGMSEIPVASNRFDKDPHNSHHYEDTLECMTCHREHKKSHAICVDCHIVEFENFK
ncbi:cytochrome c3 family protein [Shewanella sp. GXUN23E]